MSKDKRSWCLLCCKYSNRPLLLLHRQFAPHDFSEAYYCQYCELVRSLTQCRQDGLGFDPHCSVIGEVVDDFVHLNDITVSVDQ